MRELRELVNLTVAWELMPKNPIHAHVFDNGGETVDRYTIYLRTKAYELFDVYTMSADPFSPQGVNQEQTPAEKEDMSQAIPFRNLPFDVCLAIMERAV